MVSEIVEVVMKVEFRVVVEVGFDVFIVYEYVIV